MATFPVYELFAIRYAEHADRKASENFIGGDPHDGPMPLDYFVWVIRGEGHVYLVDTGFNAQTAAKRNRVVLRTPAEGLALLGIPPDDVTDTILTHLHYDHAGNVDQFPKSRFHLQDKEMQYATGRYMTHGRLRVPFDADQVCLLVHEVYRDHVVFHDGDWELTPGISVHLIGGHTLGLQVVRVHTKRGWVVLASDASHLYANFEQERPFPIVHNVGDMIEGYTRLRELADSADHIIPGHDPAVTARYPAPSPESAKICMRLDVARAK
jgi:glyoxylase-like metal-dependent hydrolase (beta-lactamase superfamily II)